MESQQKGGGSSSSRPQALDLRPDAAAGTGRMTTRQQQHVKVKHIVTTEVSTDAASFKDLVQSLTGKDSGAAREAAVAAAGRSGRRSNDAFAGGAIGVVNNDTVAGVLPSSEERINWFWPDAPFTRALASFVTRYDYLINIRFVLILWFIFNYVVDSEFRHRKQVQSQPHSIPMKFDRDWYLVEGPSLLRSGNPGGRKGACIDEGHWRSKLT